MLVPSVPVHLHDAAVGPGHLSPIMISVGMGAVPVGIMALRRLTLAVRARDSHGHGPGPSHWQGS